MAIPPQKAHEQALEAADFIHNSVPACLQHPQIAIVCGSGLAGLQNALAPSPRIAIPYADIPHFPTSMVAGHEGTLLIGTIDAPAEPIPVLILLGRAHFYEGHSLDTVTFATRLITALSIPILLLTNASGSLNPSFAPGDIVLLSDHLNLPGLAGSHPLRGPHDPRLGPRFPPLSDAYDLSLRHAAHRAWAQCSASVRSLHEGTYAFVAGPTYETRAEARMLRAMGADVVGMSTVPEVVVARQAGVRVLALSLVTNAVVMEAPMRGDDPKLEGLSEAEMNDLLAKGKAGHEEVLEAGREAAIAMEELVRRICVAIAL